MHFRARQIRLNGRRGAFLLLWAIVYSILALAYFLTGQFPPALRWMAEFTPGELLGCIWAVAAIFAFPGAYTTRPKDAYAFAALTTGPVIFASIYIVSYFITYEFTAILGVAMYTGIAVMVMVVSGMEGATDRAERLKTEEL